MKAQKDTHELTYLEAVHATLIGLMEIDESIICFDMPRAPETGLSVAMAMGADRAPRAPLSEMALAGAGIGSALVGMRPVVSIGAASFMLNAFAQIVNEASLQHYMSGGQVSLPIVFYTANGAVRSEGAQHALAVQAMLWNTPGLKVVLPSSVADVQGLLASAIADPNPVVFLDNVDLYDTTEIVSTRVLPIPFGQAAICRTGRDVTVVATSVHVRYALEAATVLADEGIDVEVVNPRTLVPFDSGRIAESVRKTHRLVVVDGSNLSCGVASEIAARLGYLCFHELVAPIERVGKADTPIPFSPCLSEQLLPGSVQVADAVRAVVAHGR